MTHPTAAAECTHCTRMAWSPAEQAALSEIMHDRTRWPLLECKGEGADAVFDEAEVRPAAHLPPHALQPSNAGCAGHCTARSRARAAATTLLGRHYLAHVPFWDRHCGPAACFRAQAQLQEHRQAGQPAAGARAEDVEQVRT